MHRAAAPQALVKPSFDPNFGKGTRYVVQL
jgi:hypothetical protein